MRSYHLVILTTLTLTTTSLSSCAASEIFPISPITPSNDSRLVNETPRQWFVELSSQPVADGGSLKLTSDDKRALRAAIKQKNIAVTELNAFDTLFNGVVLKGSVADIARVQRLSGVVAIYPVQKHVVPHTEPHASPELFYALNQTGADIAHSERTSPVRA